MEQDEMPCGLNSAPGSGDTHGAREAGVRQSAQARHDSVVVQAGRDVLLHFGRAGHGRWTTSRRWGIAVLATGSCGGAVLALIMPGRDSAWLWVVCCAAGAAAFVAVAGGAWAAGTERRESAATIRAALAQVSVGSFSDGRASEQGHQRADSSRDTLPARPGTFVGRSLEEAEIRKAAADAVAGRRACVVSIYGKPGVGKSTLVTDAAHLLAPSFPDARVHIGLDAMGPSGINCDEALERLLTALDADPGFSAPSWQRVQALRRHTATARAMAVLDDVSPDENCSVLVLPGPHCLTILTSRSPLTAVQPDVSIRLGTLGREDSIALLMALNARSRPRPALPQATARTLAELCGDLPLALRIIAALLSNRVGRTPEELVRELENERKRLDLMKVGDIEVRASFSLSYSRLSPEQARTFRLMSLLETSAVSDEVAAAAAGEKDLARARTVLEALAGFQLLEPLGTHLYAFHSLLRVYARDCSRIEDSEAERTRAIQRALTVLSGRAQRHAQVLEPPPPGDSEAPGPLPSGPITSSAARPAPPALPEESSQAVVRASTRDTAANAVKDALHALDSELPQPNALVIQALRCGEQQAAVTIALSTWDVIELRGRYEEVVTMLTAVRDGADALSTEQSAAICFGLGRSLRRLGRSDEAQSALIDASRLFREADRTTLHARALAELGILARECGDLDAAEEYYRQAYLAIRSRSFNPAQAAGILSEYGVILKGRGQFEEAATAIQEALSLLDDDLPDDFRRLNSQAWARENLGAIRKRQGHLRTAAELHSQSLRSFATMNDPLGAGFSLRNLGDVALAQRRLKLATDCYEAAVKACEATGSPLSLAQAHASLALAYLLPLRLPRAARHVRAAAREVGLVSAAKLTCRTGVIAVVAGARDVRWRSLPPTPPAIPANRRDPDLGT